MKVCIVAIAEKNGRAAPYCTTGSACRTKSRKNILISNRGAVISKAWRSTLFGVIGNLMNETGCKTTIVNGVADCALFLRIKTVSVGCMARAMDPVKIFSGDNPITMLSDEGLKTHSIFDVISSAPGQRFETHLNKKSF